MSCSIGSESEFDLSGELQTLVPTATGFATRHNLRWDIYGEGSVRILILAGATQSRLSCIGLVRSLLRDENRSVLLMDHPGAPGASVKGCSSIWSTLNMAKNLIVALHEIGWHTGPALHVCGFSLGGLVSMHLALLLPKRLASVTLVSVYGRFRQPSTRGLGRKVKSLLTAPFSKSGYAAAEVRLLYSPSYLALPDPTGVFASQKEAITRTVLHRTQIERQSLCGFLGQNWACRWHHLSKRQRAMLATQRDEVLIVAGAKDIIVSPSCSTKLADQLGCRLHIFSEAGHSPQFQFLDEFAALLKEHIDLAESPRPRMRFSLSA